MTAIIDIPPVQHIMGTVASCTALGNIVRGTQQFIQNASVQPRPSPTHQSTPIPRVRCLPDPPSLYQPLIAAGAEDRIARAMDRAYNARALQLRSYYEVSINKAFAAFDDHSFPRDTERRILDTFASLYLAKVMPCIEEVVAAYKRHRNAATPAEASRNTNPRRTFNADYVPLLEHFFDENPFPSQVDKLFLAKKSGMTYRQIHVWFQNRRNRLKKLDGDWRRKPTGESAIFPLDNLRKCMEEYAVHTEQVSSPPLEACRSSQKSTKERRYLEKVSVLMTRLAEDDNVLEKCIGPPHAFPLPYPPICTYKPFPLESRDQMLSVFQWKRHPDHNTSQPCKIDIDDLVDRFALLSVRDTFPKWSQKNHRGIQDSHAATYSITVTPPPAPHPALIRPMKDTFSPARPSLLPIVRASQSTSEAFTTFLPSSFSNSSPSYSENDIPSRRRVSPLPSRRYPRQSPLPCRNATPATPSVSSSTPSPCSSSQSLLDSLDFEGETGPPTPHSPSPRAEVCPTVRRLHVDA